MSQLERAARESGNVEDFRNLARFYAVNGYRGHASALLSLIERREKLTTDDLYCRAFIELEEGKLKAADSVLTSATLLSPDDVAVWSKLAQIRLKMGDGRRAHEAYQKVLELDPGRGDAVTGLARLKLQAGEDREAIENLRKFIDAHPDAVSAEALLSQVYDRVGNQADAAAMKVMSEQQIELLPNDVHEDRLYDYCYDPITLSLRFEVLMFGGRFERAFPLLDRVEKLDPGTWVAPMLRGWGELRSGHLDRAISSFRESLDRGADRQRLVPSLVSALQKLNDPRSAWMLASESLKIFPSSIPLQVAGAQVAVDGTDRETARHFLESVTHEHPELYTPAMALVRLLWTSPAEQPEAVKLLTNVARLYPTDLASRGLLAEYYLARGQADDALHFLEEALANSKGNNAASSRVSSMIAAAQTTRGNQYFNTDLQQALRAYEQALSAEPKNKEALLGAANASAELQHYSSAVEYLSRLQAEDPENPTILISLGDVLYFDGKPAEAIEAWKKGLPLAAGHSELEGALSQRIKTGRPEEVQE